MKVKRHVAAAILLAGCLGMSGCEELATVAEVAGGAAQCLNRCGNDTVCQNQCANEKADEITKSQQP